MGRLKESCLTATGQINGVGRERWSTGTRSVATPSEEWHPPFVLAGGLTPENVAAAIQAIFPAAVDTASGVEQSPGRKDPLRVVRFVQEARRALSSDCSNRDKP